MSQANNIDPLPARSGKYLSFIPVGILLVTLIGLLKSDFYDKRPILKANSAEVIHVERVSDIISVDQGVSIRNEGGALSAITRVMAKITCLTDTTISVVFNAKHFTVDGIKSPFTDIGIAANNAKFYSFEFQKRFTEDIQRKLPVGVYMYSISLFKDSEVDPFYTAQRHFVLDSLGWQKLTVSKYWNSKGVVTPSNPSLDIPLFN